MKKHLFIISLLAVASAAIAQTTPVAPIVKLGPGPGAGAAQPRMMPGAAPVRPDPAVMAKRQLDRFDTNKDGKVTLKEFLAPAAENFGKIDINKDGNLTAEEMAESHKRQMQEFEKMRAAHADKAGRPLGPRPAAGAPAGGMMAAPAPTK